MSKRFCSITAGLCLLVLLTGCATSGPYPFDKPGEKKAWVKAVDGGSISMCKDNQVYKLSPMTGSTIFEIPAGSETSVGRFLYVKVGNVSYSCLPRIAFVPQEGKHYVMDVGLINDACYAHVAREDERTPTGLAFEMSMRRSDCYQAETTSRATSGVQTANGPTPASHSVEQSTP